MKLGRKPAIAIKFGISILLVAYVLYRSDPRSVLEAAKGVQVGWVLLAFLLHVPGYLVSSWRWQILLRAQGIRIGFPRLLALYLVGTFFNLFLPTQVGGDIMRIIHSSNQGESKAVPAMVILVERTGGVVALLLLALGAAMLGFGGGERQTLVLIILAVLCTVALVVFLLFHPCVEKGRGKVAAMRMPGIVREKGQRLYGALHAYGSQRKSLLAALGLSFVLQILVIVHYFFIGVGLGISEKVFLLDFFLVVPMVHLVTAIPISLGGLGVRELTFVALLGTLGVPSSQATALSLIYFFLVVPYGLIGGGRSTPWRQVPLWGKKGGGKACPSSLGPPLISPGNLSVSACKIYLAREGGFW